MPALNLIITDAGRAALVAPGATLPVVLNQVALGSGNWTPTAAATALNTEVKRVTAIGGSAAADTLHVTATDASSDTYTLREVGLYTADGVLFAIYAQSTPILTKAASTMVLLALDCVLTSIAPGSVTVGDANFSYPLASTGQAGVAPLATAAQLDAATAGALIVTPEIIARHLVPIGFPGAWPSSEPPVGWLVRDGGEYARNTYPKLFNATHPARTGTTTNGSAVVTGLSRTDDLHVGMAVEYGAVNTTIASINSSSQITLAAPATVTGPRTFWIFFYGRPANGSNFYVPDDRAAFERMWDSGAGINPGRPFGSLELDALQGHNHAISQAMETPQGGSQILAGRIDPSNSYRVSRTRDEFVANGSYGTPRIADETRPYNRAYLPIIRAY